VVPEARLTPGFVFSAGAFPLMFTFHMNKRAQGLSDPRAAPTLAGIEKRVLDMRKTAVSLLCLMLAPGFAHAAVQCLSTSVPQATPLRATVIAPVSSELAASAYQLGTQVSVLSQAYDESQSADQVLLRLRIEGCQNVAKAMPAPSAIKADDPAAYKPKTEFDNTPWRFDMSQNGKRMTADEFSAWMQSRGVRVAKGATPAAAATPPAATPAADGTVPAADVPAATEPAAEAKKPTTP
jgi:hypothetical protein